MSPANRTGRLFAVGSEVYRWEDVVELAKLRGDWASLADQVRAGLAALAELERLGHEPSDDELGAAARQFRYERDLLAADELAAWLEKHDLTRADWDDYLRRALARDRLPSPSGAAPDDDVEGATWCEGICSGRLEQLARDLATMAAVTPGCQLDSLQGSFDAFRQAAVDATAEARELEANRLEWLRFTYEALLAENEGTAFEAALCIRADGESLEAVAARAGLDVLVDECWLEELDPALGTRFLAATAGEVVGPVPVQGGFVVARVSAKVAPSLDDPDVQARAGEAAVARAVGRLVADRVVWA